MELSSLHVHLMLNHVPLLGSIVAAMLLGWGLLRGSAEVTRLGLVAAILVALLTVPAYLTGEPAEDQLRELVPDVNRDTIEEHEEQGEIGFIAVLATGALAAVGLWLGRRAERPSRTLAMVVCAALVVCFGLFGWISLLGGEIRHSELRGAAAPAAPEPPR